MESQARHQLGSLHFVSRLLERCGCRQHRRGVRSACSASPRQRKKKSRGFKNHREAPVLRDPRADTPAWSSESRRQLPANVRARKTVQKTSGRDEQQCWQKPQRQGKASATPAET
ncbi:hypothetical protein ANCDUO_05985 [Ancylostoma duodenale]|uniref:Uncharacterized protein n=1 Tax=Ancylostoma duodenale TaxID=51022 RepID=A0A0C2DM70_9BILA|nr:hypothetical protein ANCDUO_05985 [Ancylostoma duodenale]